MTIEQIVYDYLTSMIDATVYLDIPGNPPERYVFIEKTGASVENYIKTATFAIQSYGKSLLEACELNEEVKMAMSELNLLDEVTNCSLNTDYNYTDTTKKKYRYQAVFDITHY